jgi:hypothetical protein
MTFPLLVLACFWEPVGESAALGVVFGCQIIAFLHYLVYVATLFMREGLAIAEGQKSRQAANMGQI